MEFYSNDQTSKSILEKSRGDMKKQKAVIVADLISFSEMVL